MVEAVDKPSLKCILTGKNRMALGQAILVASDQRLVFCVRASDPALVQMLIEEYKSWTQEKPYDPGYSVSLP